MRCFRICLSLLLLTTTGCAATFKNGAATGPEQTSWSHFFVLGLFGDSELDARDVCETAQFSQVKTGANGLTIAATLLTVGIYTPRRTVYVCQEPPK